MDFRHTVIILTSNLGAEHLTPDNSDQDGQPTGLARDLVMNTVSSLFRPEFLNRLDEILIFNRLVQTHMTAIVEIELAELEQRLAERGYGLVVSDAAKAYLARVGYDARYGARPLKRAVVRHVSNPMAEHFAGG